LRFNETTTPPEMQENQRCQSENCKNRPHWKKELLEIVKTLKSLKR
jgi:hypothetical protein